MFPSKFAFYKIANFQLRKTLCIKERKEGFLIIKNNKMLVEKTLNILCICHLMQHNVAERNFKYMLAQTKRVCISDFHLLFFFFVIFKMLLGFDNLSKLYYH